MTFDKPAQCVKEQINRLKSRGLNFIDVEFAKTILGNITYYRLSAYMKYFQDKSNWYYNDNDSYKKIILEALTKGEKNLSNLFL